MNSLDASMGNLNIGQKCIEVRIRTLPNTERSDRKDVSRVFLSMDTLLDLRIEAGQPCSLWKAGEVGDDAAKRKEAIAWPSAQKINKNVMQMFKTFQDHCGFRLEDTIAVTTAGPLMTADTVVLRDVTAGKALEEKDKEHWEWYLEDKLCMSFNCIIVACSNIIQSAPSPYLPICNMRLFSKVAVLLLSTHSSLKDVRFPTSSPTSLPPPE